MTIKTNARERIVHFRATRHWATAVCGYLGSIVLMGCSPPDSPSVVFEPESRAVSSTSATDPQPITRASGAIATLVVQPAAAGGNDLVLYQSESGGDVYREGAHANAMAGEVLTHGEGAPRFLAGRDGKFYALWLARDPDRGSVLRVARSDDFLRSFRSPVTIKTGGGRGPSFFTADLAPDGTLIVAWLGRGAGETRPGTMQLLVTSSRDRGNVFTPPVVAAGNVCPCCRPAIEAEHPNRWYLSWRDTDANHVRNIVLATSKDRGLTWSAPLPVPGEPWQIAGCPHAGPALMALGEELLLAWYTESGGTAKVLAARTADEGKSFSRAIDIGGAIVDPNHPNLAVTAGRLFVAFQGRDANQREGFGPSRVYVREIRGEVPVEVIAVPMGEGSAAYPTIEALGADKLLVTWTDSSEGGSVARTTRGRIVGP